MSFIDQEIRRLKLLEMAKAEGVEKAIRCAFLSGGNFELESVARGMRTSDCPGATCDGWGGRAADYIDGLVNGNNQG